MFELDEKKYGKRTPVTKARRLVAGKPPAGRTMHMMHMSEAATMPPDKNVPPSIGLDVDDDAILDAMQNQIDSSDYLLGVVKKVKGAHESAQGDCYSLSSKLKSSERTVKQLVIERDIAASNNRRHEELLDQVVGILFGKDACLSHDQIIEAMQNLKTRRAEKNARLEGLQEENDGLKEILQAIKDISEEAGMPNFDTLSHGEMVEWLMDKVEGLSKDNKALDEMHECIRFLLHMESGEHNIGDKIKALHITIKEREAEANSYRELYNGLLKSVDGMSKNELISLNNDRNLAIKLQVESEAKASKLGAEKRKLLELLPAYLTTGKLKLFKNRYKLWLDEQAAKRKGKVTA